MISYTVSYSFTGWQAVNPNRPLPAAPLDVELDNIAASLASVIAAVNDVRRADGALQNGVVTWDGLDDDVKDRISNLDPRVTIADLNPAAFASLAEAEAGVSNDKIMTPQRTGQALDALRAFASQSQAQAGTSTTTVLSPARGKDQIDEIRPFATQVAAEAGAVNTSVMTPLRTAQALAALRTAFSATASLTWAEITAGNSAEQSVTVNGAVVGDRVAAGLPAAGIDTGLVLTAWVSAADTVRVRLTNITASPITPASGAAATYGFTVLRF